MLDVLRNIASVIIFSWSVRRVISECGRACSTQYSPAFGYSNLSILDHYIYCKLLYQAISYNTTDNCVTPCI